MSKYTFTFTYDIYDKVIDLLTDQEVTIIGVSYLNGDDIMSPTKWFHEELYSVQFADGAKDVRLVTEIQNKSINITVNPEGILNECNVKKVGEILDVVYKMSKEQLPNDFIVSAGHMALRYDGVYDLFMMWYAETEQEEKDKIVADIKEMLDEIAKNGQK